MKYSRVKKSFKRTLFTALSVSSITGVFVPHATLIAQANTNDNGIYYENHRFENPDFIVTLDNIHDLWHMFFDTNYKDVVFEFTDEACDAFGYIWIESLQAELETLSEEYFAQIDEEIEAFLLEEKYFWENLSPEFLWEQYVIDNPNVLRMRSGELDEIKEEVTKLYEVLVQKKEYQEIEAFASSIFGNVSVERLTRWLASDAGMSLATRNAIEVVGGTAWADAVLTRRAQGWEADGPREDAYRHWIWNARAVRNVTVGATAAERTSRTRLFTTYREIASFIWRHAQAVHGVGMNIGVTGPTSAQITLARNMRRDFINMNETVWLRTTLGGFNTPNGRSEQMDLWNNHWGRVDGANGAPTLARFNTRWNSTVQNTGLVRGNGTGATQMSTARQQRLRSQGFHRPF